MSEQSEKIAGEETLLGSWFQSTMDYWNSMLKMGTDPAAWTSIKPPWTEAASKGPGTSSWDNALWMNQAMLSAMSQPEMLTGLLQGIQSFPDIGLKLSRSAWDGFFFLQRQWMEKLGGLGQSTKPYVFEKLDQNAFRQWLESYKKEIQPLFNIPQLGLTRASQEKLNKVADKWHVAEIALSEFLYMLYLPVEKSIAAVQESFDEMSRDGKVPEDPKSFYKLWIKTLEGHYMTLYKSSEYLRTLHNTLNSMHDFILAQKEITSDTLTNLSIPTTRDLDDMARDLHQLKKQLRQLKKQVENQATTP